jgi:hypothetical protein
VWYALLNKTGRFHYDYYGVRVPCPNIAPVAFESAGCERGLLGSNIYRAQSVGSIYVSPVHINNKTAQHATATSECKLRCHGKVHFDCDVNGVELFNVFLSVCAHPLSTRETSPWAAQRATCIFLGREKLSRVDLRLAVKVLKPILFAQYWKKLLGMHRSGESRNVVFTLNYNYF